MIKCWVKMMVVLLSPKLIGGPKQIWQEQNKLIWWEQRISAPNIIIWEEQRICALTKSNLTGTNNWHPKKLIQWEKNILFLSVLL
jgi:hypothetical protein